MAAPEVNQTFCTGQGCSKVSKLTCPTCLKLGIKDSYFCSQECFKGNWGSHKLLHKKAPVSTFDPFPLQVYTGKLRAAYPLSPKRILPQHIARPDYAETGTPYSEMKLRGSSKIEILNEEQIAGMREVCRLAREVLDIAAAAIRVGITTDEIDKIVHEACIERNAYPSPLNYHNFPKSCCTSVNEVICHGIPDQRPLEDGDILNIDITLYYNGYHGDLNETYFVGTVDEASRKLVEASRECLNLAIDMVKPGALYRDFGAAIEKYAKSQKLSVVRTYCGHGINSQFHCAPNVPHYKSNKAVGVMKEGHTFTIEPMINQGVWHDDHWPDNWTAVTRDGKRSSQFEHTLLVTSQGCEILTAGINERKNNYTPRE